MKLKVLGSSSKGNCYVLDSGDVAIILECGIRFFDVKVALNFNISKIAAVLITHSHGDHAKYVKSFMDAGIPVFGSQDTMIEARAAHHNYRPIVAGKTYEIPKFGYVTAFDVKHDVRCFGYLIQTLDGNTFCFITDTHYIPARFSGLNNIILECNFDDEIMDQQTGTPVMVRRRVLTSHLSFDLCKDFLTSTDLSLVNNIVLIHLSDRNSNAERFKKEIIELTGKNVHIADTGMEIDFDAKPF
jgi:phosphoribosyl 1,2-cyclic phosphodiesterase